MAVASVQGFTPVALIPYSFYCWALMLVMIFAAFSGWGRDFMTEQEYQQEALELASLAEG